MDQNSIEFPLVKSDLVSLVGFFYNRLIDNTIPKIRPASLSAYLSGIRKKHEALGLGTLATADKYIALKAVCDGYEKATEGVLQHTDTRVVLTPEIIYKILLMSCKEGASLAVVRDSALIFGAGTYGIRPAGAQSVRT